MRRIVKFEDVWKLAPGVMIKYKDSMGIYLGKEEWGYEVWDGLMKETLDDESGIEEVEVWNAVVDVAEVYKAQKAHIMNLMGEGWRLDPGSRYMDLTSELDKLRVMKAVLNVESTEE